MTIPTEKSAYPTLLFDGVCNLCNGSVQAVIRLDKAHQFRFASLQSDFGQGMLDHYGLSRDDIDSVILIDERGAHVKSEAALRVFGHLKGGYRLVALLRIIPRSIRDAIYDWVARNRYEWFGKQETCMIPTPELKDRFLD